METCRGGGLLWTLPVDRDLCPFERVSGKLLLKIRVSKDSNFFFFIEKISFPLHLLDFSPTLCRSIKKDGFQKEENESDAGQAGAQQALEFPRARLCAADIYISARCLSLAPPFLKLIRLSRETSRDRLLGDSWDFFFHSHFLECVSFDSHFWESVL